jgi:tRNA 2-thiocytidine biosynthesis protein TtcA
VAERDIARYARGRNFPIIPCTLCGSQDNMQRVTIKKMLAQWERDFPGRTESIFSALRHVETEHLADPRRFDFAGLEGRRTAGMADLSAMPPTIEMTDETATIGVPDMPGMTAMTEAEEAALETRLDSAPAFA